MNKLVRTVTAAAMLLQGAAPALCEEIEYGKAPIIAQTALLEATRQDMITYRLTQLAAEFEYLAKDLRSNGISDKSLDRDLIDLASRIGSLRDDWVGKVSEGLSEVAADAKPGPQRIAAIQRDVQKIVRKLAALLLRAGVRHAMEVCATRIDDITDKQFRLMDSAPAADAAAARQRGIAAELEELVSELRSLGNPFRNPLSAVRLARVRKMIERGQTVVLLTDAAGALKDTDREKARKAQSEALGVLHETRQKLREAAESERRKKIRRRRIVASGRLDHLRTYQDRQLDFVTKAQSLEPGDPNIPRLAAQQSKHIEAIEAFMASLPEEDKWTPAIRAPLREAVDDMRNALSALEREETGAVLEASKAVTGSLRRAADRLDSQITVLEEIDSHLELAESMRYASRFLDDVEHEQKDLRAAPEATQASNTVQRLVAGALGQLRETVEGLADAAVVAEPMQEAQDAMTSLLKKADLEPQEVDRLRTQAEQRVHTARQRALAVADRAEYVAEWLDYLGSRQAGLLSLLARQIALRKRTQREDHGAFPELAGEQDVLLAETRVYAAGMEVGGAHYATAAEEMQKAIGFLKKVQRDEAVVHQRRAEEALRLAAEALADLMGLVADITSLEYMAAYEAGIHVLTKVIMLAVEQRKIRDRTRAAMPEQLQKFTKREQEHLRRATLALAADEEAAYFEQLTTALPAAAMEMEKAVAELSKPARSKAIRHQQLAEKILRTAMATLLTELLAISDQVAAEGEVSGGGGEMLNVAMPMETVRIFAEVPAEPYQEESRAGRSTWEPLNPRERAALSENFARELPLEYRGLLKAYYRALSE
jgi:hypothetical protein